MPIKEKTTIEFGFLNLIDEITKDTKPKQRRHIMEKHAPLLIKRFPVREFTRKVRSPNLGMDLTHDITPIIFIGNRKYFRYLVDFTFSSFTVL